MTEAQNRFWIQSKHLAWPPAQQKTGGATAARGGGGGGVRVGAEQKQDKVELRQQEEELGSVAAVLGLANSSHCGSIQ